MLRALVREWERGGRVTDEQYLRLRYEVVERHDEVCQHALGNLLGPCIERYVLDAAEYYHVAPVGSELFRAAWMKAVEGALIIPREDVVAWDAASPVQSHFERLFCEVFKLTLFGLLRIKFLDMPAGEEAFQSRFEAEWKRALRYGNGYYGLTIIPRVSILDAVRYQQLGGRDRVISRSLVEFYVLQLGPFPHFAQMVAPLFGEKAIKARLMAMFDPLVRSCVVEASRRLAAVGERYNEQTLTLDFQAVLSDAIDEYQFMYGKTGTWQDGVGMIGLSASEHTRQKVDAALREPGYPLTSKDLVHINASGYITARLRQHLRSHYPPPWREKGELLSLDFVLDADDGKTALGDVLTGQESWAQAGWWSQPEDALAPGGTGRAQRARGSTPGVRVVAAVVDGTEYLFVDEMAALCGVTPEQLRTWDRKGLLRASRLGKICPAHRGKVSRNWRVYPNTEETRQRIAELAYEHRPSRTGLEEGEFSRKQAAKVLGVHKDTLRRLEKRGLAKPQWRDNRPIYTVEEIRRLRAVIEVREPRS